MNERIKELAEQSGFYFYDLHDIGGHDMGETIEADSWEAAEKFAELIIKDCLEEIDDTDLTRLEGPDPEDVIWLVTKHLKERFGIE